MKIILFEFKYYWCIASYLLLGTTRNSICSLKNVIWRFFSNLTLHPLSRTSWKFSWKFFTSHSVSMICKLTPLPSTRSLALVIVQLESALNSLYSYTAVLTAFLITFKLSTRIFERWLYISIVIKFSCASHDRKAKQEL